MSHDPRISVWPRLKVRRNSVSLKARILTPMQYSWLEHILFKPAALIWNMVFLILVLDRGLLLFGTNIFALYTEFDRELVYWTMAALFALYHAEHLLGFPLSRFVLGKYIQITIKKGCITIASTFMRKRICLNHHPSFGLMPIAHANSPAYHNAQSLHLVIAQSRSIKLAEIFNVRHATLIVNNANTALAIAQEKGL